LARSADHFRSSDVNLWAIIALVACSAAVTLANISALFPADLLGGLHASRLELATVTQLRAQVAELVKESSRTRQRNDVLLERFALAEKAHGDVARRVGALEFTLPLLAEGSAGTAAIDDSSTASIIENGALALPPKAAR
jgi:hypothetical protein